MTSQIANATWSHPLSVLQWLGPCPPTNHIQSPEFTSTAPTQEDVLAEVERPHPRKYNSIIFPVLLRPAVRSNHYTLPSTMAPAVDMNLRWQDQKVVKVDGNWTVDG